MHGRRGFGRHLEAFFCFKYYWSKTQMGNTLIHKLLF